MSEDQATCVRDAYEALRRADVGGVLARMSPDVQWHLRRRSVIGRGEVEELLTGLKGRAWPATDLVVDDLTAADGRVLVTGSCGERFVHAWTLRGEVLAELRVLPA
jgi:ketosteroid isomerase-like protein